MVWGTSSKTGLQSHPTVKVEAVALIMLRVLVALK